MSPKLQNKLFNKYPKIFIEKNLPRSKGCMQSIDCDDGWYSILNALCYKIQKHIDNPPWVPKHTFGTYTNLLYTKLIWNPFLFPLLNKLPHEDYIRIAEFWSPRISLYEPPKKTIQQVVAKQIKEKFGTLTFYYSGGDAYIRGCVSMASCLSNYVCERCGISNDTVSKTDSYWIRTLCKSCFKDIK